MLIASSRHDRAAIEHREPVTFKGRRLRVAAAEDLVLYKPRAWREQDRIDIRRLLTGVSDLDRTYIESWLDPITEDTGEPVRERWLTATS